MATLAAPAPAVKPITVAAPDVDPWYADRPAYAVEVADLHFGVRVTHRELPGMWKIVRGPERLDSGRRYHVRARQQAPDGSLFGKVMVWTIDQIAGIVTDEPPPAQAEAPAFTPWPEMFATGRVVARGDASWLPPTSRIQAVVQRDMVRHALMEMGATLPPDDEPRLVDDDGTPLETPREMERRHREEHEAAVRELLTDNPFLRDADARAAYDDMREKLAALEVAEDAVRLEGEARQVEKVPCCPAGEPLPCSACVHADEPTEVAWADDDVITLGPDAEPFDDRPDDATLHREDLDAQAAVCELRADWLVDRPDDDEDDDDEPFAAWIARQARTYATMGTPRASWLAAQITALAERADFLGADSPDAFADKLEAMRDAARDAAEARAAARCC